MAMPATVETYVEYCGEDKYLELIGQPYVNMFWGLPCPEPMLKGLPPDSPPNGPPDDGGGTEGLWPSTVVLTMFLSVTVKMKVLLLPQIVLTFTHRPKSTKMGPNTPGSPASSCTHHEQRPRENVLLIGLIHSRKLGSLLIFRTTIIT